MHEADPTLAVGPETSAASKTDLRNKFQMIDRSSGKAIKGAEQVPKSQVVFIRGSAKREILPL